MAEGITTTGANTALNAVLAAYPWIKLHIGAPGASGTSNPATETTRKQAAWNAAANNVATNSGALTWTGVTVTGSEEDYTQYSGWSAESGGSCGHTGTLASNPVGSGDNYTISAGALTQSIATLAS